MRTDRWAVVLLDRRGKVASWSEAAADLVGIPRSQALGVPFGDLLRTEDGRDFSAYVAEMSRDVVQPAPVVRVRGNRASPTESLRLTFVRATEDRVALILGGQPANGDAKTSRFGLLEELGLQVREGVVLSSPDLDEPGPLILYANEAARSLMGWAGGDGRGESLLSFLDPEPREGLRQRVRDALRRDEDGVTEQVLVSDGAGQHRLVEWSIRAVRAAAGRTTHYVSVQREAPADALRGAAFRGVDVDPLTGLPNRARFLARLGRSLEWVRRGEHYAFTLLGFDIGELELTERRWGVAVANLIVEALAWRIRRSLRPLDLVARIAHDRLGVLVEHNMEDQHLMDVMGRIRREIAEPYVIGGQRIVQPITVAMLPFVPDPEITPDAEEILRTFEHALTSASGEEAPEGLLKARVGAGTGGTVSGTVGLELRRALNKGELRLRYQPIVRLEDDSIQGLEAFVLWEHPTRGLLPARAFLHHAEGTGLMPSIGRWVAAEACRHLHGWRMQRLGEPFPAIHLNLSSSEFWDPEPVKRILDVIRQEGASPGDFRLEVSEGTLSRNPAAASLVLESFIEAGFQVWLEGFGGGRLSMRDLLWLPFRNFKLDAGLLWEESPTGGRSPASLMLGLARLAQELRRTVVAANVETDEERELLPGDCCTLGQGSFYARPVDPDAVPMVLTRAAAIIPR